MNSCLIFGGTGFIGRHLSLALVAQGLKGISVSRSPDQSFIRDHLHGINGITLADFRNEMDYHFEKSDTLIYAASSSIPTTYRDRPWAELSSNAEPAFELFSRAHEVNPEIRVVFLSSGGTIYGPGHVQPIVEEAPLQPISPYGLGKLVLEEAIKFLGRTRGLNYAILRIANPIGKWQSNPKQGIVNVAIRSALANKSVMLYNGGVQVRDFIDADDLAEAIILASAARRFNNAVWNVGSGAGYKINEVIDLVEKYTGKPITRTNVEGRAVDLEYAVVNSRKIYDDLGWKVTTSLDEGVQKILSSI